MRVPSNEEQGENNILMFFPRPLCLQVKKNLINVSYHIAQYTNIISDLRCEIQRLKKKIAEQAGRQPANSERADIRHVQGKQTLPPSSPVGFDH